MSKDKNTDAAGPAKSGDRSRFVLLRGIESGDKFFTTNSVDDPTKSATGETWYEIIGHADTVREAQEKLGLIHFLNHSCNSGLT